MLLQGTALWAKVIGDPQPGYDKSKREWSIDVVIDEKTKARLEAEGLGPKIKTNKEGEDYIAFKRPEFRKDGSPSKTIEIVGPDTKPWTGGKIGNGSVVKVSYLINETTYQGKKHLKPGLLKMQVVKHVPYEGREDFDAVPVDENGDESWGE